MRHRLIQSRQCISFAVLSLCLSASAAEKMSLEAAVLVPTARQEHRSYMVGPGVLEVTGSDTIECLLVKALNLPPYAGCDMTNNNGQFYRLNAKLPRRATVAEVNSAVAAFLVGDAKVKYHFQKRPANCYVLTRGDMHGLHLDPDGDAKTLGALSIPLPTKTPQVVGVRNHEQGIPLSPGHIEVKLLHYTAADIATREVVGKGATLAQLVSLADHLFGLTMVDQTGSPGAHYDFDYRYDVAVHDPDPADFLRQLTKQLGITVTRQKGYMVDHLIVDHVQEVH